MLTSLVEGGSTCCITLPPGTPPPPHPLGLLFQEVADLQERSEHACMRPNPSNKRGGGGVGE